MTTQELKNKIEKVLGNSIRCLLPSYWWKRIFGLLVEEIDDVRSTANSKANKSEVASLSNSVNTLSDRVDRNIITVDSSLSTTSTNPVQNKVVTNELNAIYPVFRIRKTTDSGFAAYLVAAHRVFQNTDKTNKFPIAIVGRDSGDAICDALVTTPNANELGLEFNVRNKRYRWVFNAQYGSPDIGAFIREEQVSSAGGLETRSFKSTNSTTDKEWNKETVSLFLEGKVNIVYSFNNAGLPEGTGGELVLNAHIYQDGNHRFCFFEQHPSGGYTDHGIIIQSDGTYDDDVEVFKPDTEMYDTSTNLVQNKVIKKYVDTEVAKKVDKVSGKGLSTEDFTTVLKTKLEGLKNYDDTTLTNAINSLETRLNTLVSGDTSTAIESFNEVVAFLENLTDTQDLSSIIASIEQQINAKQDKINDLEDIRSGASLGKTSLQEHQDISHLATKEEVQNIVDEVLETEEVYAAAVNDLNSRLVETNAVIDTEISTRESLATDVQTLINRVTSNEEVTATSYNELNERINNNYQEGVDIYATKVELNNEIASINTAILENEEVIAATLNDLLSQIEALRVRIEQLENA